jgi:hypothetical protein
VKGDHQTAHLMFKAAGLSESGKTQRWLVANFNGTILADIKWHGAWRKYCFFPWKEKETLYDAACLREIADFCEARTKEHRA